MSNVHLHSTDKSYDGSTVNPMKLPFEMASFTPNKTSLLIKPEVRFRMISNLAITLPFLKSPICTSIASGIVSKILGFNSLIIFDAASLNCDDVWLLNAAVYLIPPIILTAVYKVKEIRSFTRKKLREY